MPRSKSKSKLKSTLFSPVEEIYIGGGGGAGRSLPAALDETVRHGLDVKKVKVVCASSVGSILALALAIEIPIKQMFSIMDIMPADSFQDWSFPSCFVNLFSTYGFCKGEAMEAYFRAWIYEHTGLEDPTFLELYEAGYTKELRVVTANVNEQDREYFSYKTAPNQKVAYIVALSCSVSIVFPPKSIVSPEGKLALHTDGGVIQNYPFGVGSDNVLDLEKQLGFTFINRVESWNREQNVPVQNFFQYVKALISMLFFHHPLVLHDCVKLRTVAIRVDHNPLAFTATSEQQAALNEAGREGVRNLAAQLMKNGEKAEEEGAPPAPSPVLFHPAHAKRSKRGHHTVIAEPSFNETVKKLKLRVMPVV